MTRIRTITTGRRTTPAAAEPLHPDWRTKAVCRDYDPELFFPVGTTGPAEAQAEDAKRVCCGCPVIEECLTWALETRQDSGVWGGRSEAERRRLLRRRVRVRAAAKARAVERVMAEHLDELLTARSKGLSPGRIALELGTNVQTVNAVIARLDDAAALDAASELAGEVA